MQSVTERKAALRTPNWLAVEVRAATTKSMIFEAEETA